MLEGTVLIDGLTLEQIEGLYTGYVTCTGCGALNHLYVQHRISNDTPYLCTYCSDQQRQPLPPDQQPDT